MATTPDDFATAETFPCAVTIGVWARRFLPQFVATLLVLLLLLLVLFGSMGAGPLAWPLALVPTAALGTAMCVAKKRQFDETWATATLILSPDGAVVVERHCRLELPWDQVRAIRKADLVNKGSTPSTGYGRAGLIAGLLSMAVIATSRRRGQDALVGTGRLTVSPSASKLVRGQIARNQGARDFDPRTHRRLTAILLPAFDEDWRTGRIGAWVRAHRPDLLSGTART